MKYLCVFALTILMLISAACDGDDAEPTLTMTPIVLTSIPPTATPIIPTTTEQPSLTPTETQVVVNTAIPPATATSTTVAQAPILTLTTQTASVDAVELSLRVGRVDLSWLVKNRPPNTNLVFEQVMYGQAYSVELPRNFLYVSSTGSGKVAPFLPSGDTTQIQLQMRLYSEVDGATLATTEVVVPVINQPDSSFVVSDSANCYDSPYGSSNFLKVGRTGFVHQDVPVDLPLSADAGIGQRIVGRLLLGDSFTVLDGPFCFHTLRQTTMNTFRQWRVRSNVTSAEGWVYEYVRHQTTETELIETERNFDLYTGDDCYTAPFPASRGIAIGEVARILYNNLELLITTYGSDGFYSDNTIIERMPANSLVIVVDGPYCFQIGPPYTYSNSRGLRQWKVEVDATGTVGWVYEYSSFDGQAFMLATDGQPESTVEIVSFTASPESAGRNETVTLSWEISGDATNARIETQEVPFQAFVRIMDVTTNTGSFDVTLTDDGRLSAPYRLIMLDNNGVEVYEDIYVNILCPYDYFVADSEILDGTCPLTAPQSVTAAYQTFENGFMVWDAMTKQIHVMVNGSPSLALYVFEDTWNGEDIVFGETPPDGLFQPKNGFGKVWVENSDVRQALGWATMTEVGYTATRQQADIRETRHRIQVGPVYMTLPDTHIVRYQEVAGSILTPSWVYIE